MDFLLSRLNDSSLTLFVSIATLLAISAAYIGATIGALLTVGWAMRILFEFERREWRTVW